MPGENDLPTLLRDMAPHHNPGEYVFCSMGAGERIPANDLIGTFREREGLTVILAKQRADELRLPYSTTLAWITLTVHSDLEAVGLTAAVSHALAEAGISCNVVAAYYHDHLFVPVKDSARALAILQKLSSS